MCAVLLKMSTKDQQEEADRRRFIVAREIRRQIVEDLSSLLHDQLEGLVDRAHAAADEAGTDGSPRRHFIQVIVEKLSVLVDILQDELQRATTEPTPEDDPRKFGARVLLRSRATVGRELMKMLLSIPEILGGPDQPISALVGEVQALLRDTGMASAANALDIITRLAGGSTVREVQTLFTGFITELQDLAHMMMSMRSYQSIAAMMRDTADRLQPWNGILDGLEMFIKRAQGSDFTFDFKTRQLLCGFLNVISGCVKYVLNCRSGWFEVCSVVATIFSIGNTFTA